jgi:hypothetical protein
VTNQNGSNCALFWVVNSCKIAQNMRYIDVRYFVDRLYYCWLLLKYFPLHPHCRNMLLNYSDFKTWTFRLISSKTLDKVSPTPDLFDSNRTREHSSLLYINKLLNAVDRAERKTLSLLNFEKKIGLAAICVFLVRQVFVNATKNSGINECKCVILKEWVGVIERKSFKIYSIF